MKMRCEEIRAKLKDFLTGNLSFDESDSVEKHLSRCDSCKEELDFIGEAESLFAEMEFAEPPAEMWNNIRRKIEEDKKSPFRDFLGGFFFPSVNLRRVFAAVVAAIVILTGAGIFLLEENSQIAQSVYPSDYVSGHILTSYDDPLSDRVALNLIIAGEDNIR